MKIDKKDSITPKKIRERYLELEPLLKGNARKVAETAGCSRKRYANALSGLIKSEELLEPIYNAMEEVAKAEYEKINI